MKTRCVLEIARFDEKGTAATACFRRLWHRGWTSAGLLSLAARFHRPSHRLLFRLSGRTLCLCHPRAHEEPQRSSLWPTATKQGRVIYTVHHGDSVTSCPMDSTAWPVICKPTNTRGSSNSSPGKRWRRILRPLGSHLGVDSFTYFGTCASHLTVGTSDFPLAHGQFIASTSCGRRLSRAIDGLPVNCCTMSVLLAHSKFCC